MHGSTQVTRRTRVPVPVGGRVPARGPGDVLVGRLWLDGFGSPAGF
ncbi:hypothetical protein TOK_3039 [Pseudonocardia sp. N23]|nr:hypothetical protein TOK_3039 [Pseudonocardia sp. N23]